MKRHADHCHIHFQDKGEDPCYIAGTVVVLQAYDCQETECLKLTKI